MMAPGKHSMINGVVTDYLNINDRAIHYGDGLFETILCRNNSLYYWPQHYQRLQTSCKTIKLDCPEEQLLLSDIKTLLARNNTRERHNEQKDNAHAEDGYAIKVIVSRGTGGRGYQISKTMSPNRLVLLSGIAMDYSSLLTGTLLSGGLYLCGQQVSINENLAGLKHLNRLENVLARSEWQDSAGRSGSDNTFVDGLMLNADGHVIEGTMSNFFAVKGNQLYTPGLNRSGVRGVTRDQIISIAEKAGIAVSITDLNIDDVVNMDELFISNSLFGMKAISHFMNKPYRQHKITKSIFDKLCETSSAYVQNI